MTDLSQLPKSARPCESSQKLERGRTVKWQRKTIRIRWRCISPVMQEPSSDPVYRTSVSQNNTSGPRRTPSRPRARARKRGLHAMGSSGSAILLAVSGKMDPQRPSRPDRPRIRSPREPARARASPFSARQSSGLMLTMTCRLCSRGFRPILPKAPSVPSALPCLGLIHTKAESRGRSCDLRRPFFTRARRPSHYPERCLPRVRARTVLRRSS